MKTLRVLSLGAGVQSTALALMSHYGEIEPFDSIIFADTGWEPGKVYEQLAALQELMPIKIVKAGDVRDFGKTERKEGQTRFASIPLWIKNSKGKIAPMRRQCTREYKIDPIEKYIRRELVGLAHRQWWPKKELLLEVNLGISTDEMQRVAQDSRKKWKINRFPLIELGMSRDDCISYLKDRGFTTHRSACIGCPYRSNSEWAMINEESEEWASAVRFDTQIRHILPDAECFLHKSGIPLNQVDLSDTLNDSSLLDECSGLCSN